MDTKFELGKTYRVKFEDGREVVVLVRGGEPLKFDVINTVVNIQPTLIGIDWLKYYKSIEEVVETEESYAQKGVEK